jgi:hypothetical protein
VGRPEDSLGRRAKMTVEMASEGAAVARSETFAELPYTVAHPLPAASLPSFSYSHFD